jgi:uncharacterized Zn finger protein (UPF0148 family)
MYEIEIISGDMGEDYEVWTCKECGRTVLVNRGGDVACCPCEFEEEQEEEPESKAVDGRERDREEALNDYYERQGQQVGGYDVPSDEF